jgi:hypothetical protein
MTRRLTFTALLLAALTLAASPAFANRTPKFSLAKPSIVPGISIGGVKVGMTRHQAVATWGAPDRCVPFENVSWCQYLTTVEGITDPFAGFYLKGGKVVGVTIGLPTRNFANKVTKLKTAKGIGLGSAAATVRAKYGNSDAATRRGHSVSQRTEAWQAVHDVLRPRGSVHHHHRD